MERREFLGVMTAVAGAPFAAGGLLPTANAASADEPAFGHDLPTPHDTIRGNDSGN
jgi:hypothetical protein